MLSRNYDRRSFARRAARILGTERLESRSMMAVLSGAVFYDANGDGSRDVGEIGVPGIVIRLEGTNASNTTMESTITDDGGGYSFEGLPAGTYEITKRSSSATNDDESSPVISNLVVTADQTLGGNDFREPALRAQFIGLSWFFALAPPPHEILREAIAVSESLQGDDELAEMIRAGAGTAPLNVAPIAVADEYQTVVNVGLEVGADEGLLANDQDADGDTLTAMLVDQASNGIVTVDTDGSFTYTANADFIGSDSFTYQVNDGNATSAATTVTITIDDGINETPVAVDDVFSVSANETFRVAAGDGVLANDSDGDGDPLTARIVDPPENGRVALDTDGSFAYTPEEDFIGQDSFTYVANDGTVDSNVATSVFNVSTENMLFGPALPGDFRDINNLGVRTDQLPGAPPITRSHVDGDVDYSQHSNPPTYGDHHGFDPDGIDENPGITPRPTGIYREEQPEEDLIHNLEHGHVWISYDPGQISPQERDDLEQFVLDGSPNANGSGVGVILTPRAANDDPIAVASWARLLTLQNFNPFVIREFIEQNRGKAPEGFITP